MDRRAYKTKNALADSIKKLICEQQFEKITVNLICSRANVTRRNFYRHFMDKYDLLGWVFEHDFSFDFSEHPDWTIFDYFPFFCQILYDNRTFYMNAYKIIGQNSLREYCHTWLYPLLHRTYKDYFQSENSESQNKNIEQRLFHILNDSTFDIIVDWLSSNPCTPPDQFSKQVIDIYRTFSLYTYNLCKSSSEE